MRDIFERVEEDFALLDRKAIFALVYTAIGLTCISYLKNVDYMESAASLLGLRNFAISLENADLSNLGLLGYWVAISVFFYVVIPAVVLKLVLKKQLSDYGLKFSIESGFWKLLFQCIAVMMPLVYLMSLTPGFAAKYPFLRIYDGSPYLSTTLLIWELIYF